MDGSGKSNKPSPKKPLETFLLPPHIIGKWQDAARRSCEESPQDASSLQFAYYVFPVDSSYTVSMGDDLGGVFGVKQKWKRKNTIFEVASKAKRGSLLLNDCLQSREFLVNTNHLTLWRAWEKPLIFSRKTTLCSKVEQLQFWGEDGQLKSSPPWMAPAINFDDPTSEQQLGESWFVQIQKGGATAKKPNGNVSWDRKKWTLKADPIVQNWVLWSPEFVKILWTYTYFSFATPLSFMAFLPGFGTRRMVSHYDSSHPRPASLDGAWPTKPSSPWCVSWKRKEKRLWDEVTQSCKHFPQTDSSRKISFKSQS